MSLLRSQPKRSAKSLLLLSLHHCKPILFERRRGRNKLPPINSAFVDRILKPTILTEHGSLNHSVFPLPWRYIRSCPDRQHGDDTGQNSNTENFQIEFAFHDLSFRNQTLQSNLLFSCLW